MSGPRALVTGATGYLGRHVTGHLLESGWTVHVTERRDSDTSVLPGGWSGPGGHARALTVHTVDGSGASVRAAVAATRPDVVIHLAAVFVSRHTEEDITPLVTANVLFGCHLVDAMVREGVTAMVNTGTPWQHYENGEYSPVNLYAATRQAFADLLQYYVEAEHLRVVTLLPADTYGPDDPRPRLIPALASAARSGEPLAMSPGEQLIDLVHVRDAAAAFRIAAERVMRRDESGHERFAVSSGQAVSLRELVARLESVLGREIPVRWGERPYRPREVMRPPAGVPLPGWTPSIPLYHGLRELPV